MNLIHPTFIFLSMLILNTYSQEQYPEMSASLLCDPNNRPTSCDQGIEPVCAFVNNCAKLFCQYTAGNNCTACLDPTVQYYTLGACHYELAPIESFCPKNDSPNSNDESSRLLLSPEATVCLTFSDCNGDDCYQPAVNADYACQDPNVVSHISRACDYIKSPQKIVCDPSNRPDTCGTRTELVCAFFREDVKGPGYQTLPSPCYACLDERVEYYIPGICEEDVKENKNFCDIYNYPPPCAAPPPGYYNPACVFRRNFTEEPCSYTIDYACGACGFGIGVDYYILGACKTFCDAKSIEEFCAESSGPVCAFSRGCTGEDCGKTVDSSCAACSDEQIEYYTEGECRKIGFPEPPTD